MRRIIVAAFTLISGLAVLVAAGACGTKEETPAATTAVTWAQVDALMATNCAGSTCHGTTPGSGRKAYQGSETNFKADKLTIKSTIEGGSMPKDKAWTSAADKATVLSYLSSI